MPRALLTHLPTACAVMLLSGATMAADPPPDPPASSGASMAAEPGRTTANGALTLPGRGASGPVTEPGAAAPLAPAAPPVAPSTRDDVPAPAPDEAAAPDLDADAPAPDSPADAAVAPRPAEAAAADGPAFEATALGRPDRAGPGPAREGGRRAVLDTLDPRRHEVVRVGAALAAVLGLVLLVRFGVGRAAGTLRGSRPAGVLEICARYPVARGQWLLIIKMARRVVLVHHAGSSMTALSEVSDPDEVAALLGRMEAGSRSRDAARFSAALRRFEREHERFGGEALRPSGPETRREIEVVDLTRRGKAGRGLLAGRGSAR